MSIIRYLKQKIYPKYALSLSMLATFANFWTSTLGSPKYYLTAIIQQKKPSFHIDNIDSFKYFTPTLSLNMPSHTWLDIGQHRYHKTYMSPCYSAECDNVYLHSGCGVNGTDDIGWTPRFCLCTIMMRFCFWGREPRKINTRQYFSRMTRTKVFNLVIFSPPQTTVLHSLLS